MPFSSSQLILDFFFFTSVLPLASVVISVAISPSFLTKFLRSSYFWLLSSGSITIYLIKSAAATTNIKIAKSRIIFLSFSLPLSPFIGIKRSLKVSFFFFFFLSFDLSLGSSLSVSTSFASASIGSALLSCGAILSRSILTLLLGIFA